MANSIQDIADNLFEAFKSIEPLEAELNERAQEFLNKANTFYHEHHVIKHRLNPYTWAAGRGWKPLTVHNIHDGGVEFVHIIENIQNQWVSFDVMENFDTVLANILVEAAEDAKIVAAKVAADEVEARNIAAEKAAKRARLEAELAALDD